MRGAARKGGPYRDPYVELHCHSAYSFLDGASHPVELAGAAAGATAARLDMGR